MYSTSFLGAVLASMRRGVASGPRTLVLFGLAAAVSTALAQGGPPMVTDDPGTPGDGHWEVNVAAIATRTPGRREIAAPDADINYGWGDHVQLKLEVPWVFTRDDGQHWKSGVGAANLGVKWRFLDQEQAGFTMSTYPQYGRSVMRSSARRGITDDGHQFFLPIEAAAEIGGIGIAAEVGRNFVQGGPDQWVGGLVGAHRCGDGVECMFETRRMQSPGAHRTLLNVGTHWKINDSMSFLGALGHEFGTRSGQLREALVYLGLQISR
jgi:hypothetical protein